MRLQIQSKIERVLIFDLEVQKNRTTISWLIINGWKELATINEGLIEQINHNGASAACKSLFNTCEGAFDVVLSPLTTLVDQMYEYLNLQTPVISVTKHEVIDSDAYKMRRGNHFETLYVLSRGCSALHAAVLIRDMYGSGTMPYHLQRVSERCRKTL